VITSVQRRRRWPTAEKIRLVEETMQPAWFEDYNELHPHSGLKFLSPREFLRLSA
jgi:transposase InsO family protein